jgi:hypothetical protein
VCFARVQRLENFKKDLVLFGSGKLCATVYMCLLGMKKKLPCNLMEKFHIIEPLLSGQGRKH